MRHWVPLSLLLLVAVPAALFAEIEITPVAGYRFGDTSTTTHIPGTYCAPGQFCMAEGNSRDSEVFGVLLDVPIRGDLMLEFLVQRQKTAVRADLGVLATPLIPEISTAEEELELIHFQLGLARQWRLRKLTPYAAFGAGIARIESRWPGEVSTAVDDRRFSASLAGGVKIPVADWLGVRLETRAHYTEMPERFHEALFQVELTSGLSFRF